MEFIEKNFDKWPSWQQRQRMGGWTAIGD